MRPVMRLRVPELQGEKEFVSEQQSRKDGVTSVC